MFIVILENQITSKGIVDLANNCCKMKRLKDLILSCIFIYNSYIYIANKIDSNGIDYFSKFLKYCLKLENLTLEDNLITDAASIQLKILVRYPYRRLFVRI